MNGVLSGHVPALDGLRAFAVMAVLCVHAGMPGFNSGWLGVDLFFALSGFLITTLLLKEFDKNGTISLRLFWARRFLRLMPIYLIYVTGFTVMMWFWAGSVLSVDGKWTSEMYTLSLYGYFVNFAPKSGISNLQDYTVHLWSLAVEEQYYLFWPVIVSLCVKSRWILPVAWGGVAFVLVVFLVFSDDFERTNMLYARGLPLFLSSALALTLWKSPKWGGWVLCIAKAKALPVLVLLATGAAFVVAIDDMLNVHSVRYIFLPLLSCGFALLIVRFSCADYKVPRWLEYEWLVKIGKVSYGIYLYHVLVREGVWFYTDPLVAHLAGYQAYGIRLTLYLILTIIVALISYRFIEKPFLRMKSRCRE